MYGFFDPFSSGGGSGSGGSGVAGKDGVGIANIKKTSTSGLVDTYTITLTDGTTTTFKVTNGAAGTSGKDGTNGKDGVTPIISVSDAGDSIVVSTDGGKTYTTLVSLSDLKGEKGDKGDKGDAGEQGKDGEKGADGVSIISATVNDDGVLILTLSDSSTISVGNVKGADGTSVAIKSSKDECVDPGDAYIDEDGNLQILKPDGEFQNAGAIKGPAGRGISSVAINDEGHLLITYSDSEEAEDLGLVTGEDGFSPQVRAFKQTSIWTVDETYNSKTAYFGSDKNQTVFDVSDLEEVAFVCWWKETSGPVPFTITFNVKDDNTSGKTSTSQTVYARSSLWFDLDVEGYDTIEIESPNGVRATGQIIYNSNSEDTGYFLEITYKNDETGEYETVTTENLRGQDGRGIATITFQSSTGGDTAGIAGATDTYLITYTDGTEATFVVTNGTQGSSGSGTGSGKSAYEIAVDNGFTGTEAEWLESLKGDSSKAKIYSITLLASEWSDGTYVIENEDIEEDNYITLSTEKNITLEEYDALGFAKVICLSQEDGKITLKALGEIPSIDIPVILVIEGNMDTSSSNITSDIILTDDTTGIDYKLGIDQTKLYTVEGVMNE